MPQFLGEKRQLSALFLPVLPQPRRQDHPRWHPKVPNSETEPAWEIELPDRTLAPSSDRIGEAAVFDGAEQRPLGSCLLRSSPRSECDGSWM